MDSHVLPWWPAAPPKGLGKGRPLWKLVEPDRGGPQGSGHGMPGPNQQDLNRTGCHYRPPSCTSSPRSWSLCTPGAGGWRGPAGRDCRDRGQRRAPTANLSQFQVTSPTPQPPPPPPPPPPPTAPPRGGGAPPARAPQKPRGKRPPPPGAAVVTGARGHPPPPALLCPRSPPRPPRPPPHPPTATPKQLRLREGAPLQQDPQKLLVEQAPSRAAFPQPRISHLPASPPPAPQGPPLTPPRSQ